MIGGSFFETVPAGGDAYVLKHIIHDWPDQEALHILRNVRAAMKPDATVLLIEMVVPDDEREHMSKMLDLEMLVSLAGRERTAAEYAELLRQAGFRQTRGRNRWTCVDRRGRSGLVPDTQIRRGSR